MRKDRCAVEAGSRVALSHALNTMNRLSAPGRLWGQSNDGSAALLARLEAENANLRHRAAELALDIQKLAEKSE
jgi:hypothetical protein